MFSLKVVDTDDFLDMPPTTQNLYFHLAMRADDDGFVNSPKKVMKIVNSPEDDLKILITKQFILPFQSGVIVIRHWKENNYIRSDRYQETIYTEEKAQLKEDNCGVYQMSTNGIPNVSPGKVRLELGKVRKGKVTTEAKPTVSREGALIIEKFLTINPSLKYGNRTQRQACDEMINAFGLEETLSLVDMVIAVQGKPYAPRATTPYAMWQKIGDFKVFFDSEKTKHKAPEVLRVLDDDFSEQLARLDKEKGVM